MSLPRLENSFKIYSDDVPSNPKAGQKRKGREGDRAIPNRKWSMNQGAFNFSTIDKTHTAAKFAFGLEISDRVFHYSDSLPTLRREREVKIWELNPDKVLDLPHLVNDYYSKPLSVADSGQFLSIALGNDLINEIGDVHYGYKAARNIQCINYNRDATTIFFQEEKSSCIRGFDLTTLVANVGVTTPSLTTYQNSADTLATFSLRKDEIFAGTRAGALLRADKRAPFFQVVSPNDGAKVINIAFSNFNENLVAVSSIYSISLYDQRKMKKALKTYAVDTPKAVDFEPTGKEQVIVGSGSTDTHLRKISFGGNTPLSEFPKIKLNRQITSVKWTDEKTVFVATGYKPSNGEASRITEPNVRVIAVGEGSLRVKGAKSPENRIDFPAANERILQLERKGNEMLAVSSSEVLYHLPISKPIKPFEAPRSSALEYPVLR